MGQSQLILLNVVFHYLAIFMFYAAYFSSLYMFPTSVEKGIMVANLIELN